MEIREITDKALWDGFVASCSDYTFLQGWNWGEFHRVRGEKVWRLGVYEKEKLIGCSQAVSMHARRGNFLFVPHGPLVQEGSIDSFLPILVEKLKELAREFHYSFIRISPWNESTTEHVLAFSRLRFISAPSYMHAEETWLLPIDRDERTLLSDMRKTTRNLISRAEREGVEIIKSKKPEDLKLLLDLQAATAERNKFVPFSDSYLKTEFDVFSKDDEALLFLGKHAGVISSAAIIIFFGKRAFYFQSGSTKSVAPVSYLLQWEVIKEAKRRGCTLYNLWGVAPENKPRHPWVGFTLFKSGFGGFRKNYMHAQDLPLSKKYWLSYLIEKLPRKVRSAIRMRA